ncbi:MAG TPA: hypothetical protein VFT20_14185, partial [Candidatus Limnocylindrales bacterium]|nr:hypothetical protein [Candidatus Limnocylindrales bacterium]
MSRTQIRRAIPRKTGPLVAIVALLLTVGTALAVHDPTSPMELDGNIVDGAGGGSDWAAIFDSDGDEVAANLPAGTLDTTGVIQDFAPGASGPDPSYHEPSNKDDQAINGAAAGGVWGCVSVPNPTDKTDIVNAYGMAVQGDAETGDGDTADDQLFYFGVERFDNSGDAFIGLWLFQDEVSCNEETGKFEGSKQTGDILVLANFTGGGSNALIQLFRYTAGAGDAPGSFGELASATGKCENTALGDVAGNNLCATINDTNSFVTPWAMEDKTKPGPPSPDPVREVDPDQFVEGGVNLTDVFLEAGLTAPPCFGSFLAETRSSSSIDATLKDYALGNLDFCDANITITPTETNRVGESHTFIVDVDKVLGSGETAATVGDVEYTLTGSNGIEASDIVVDPSSTCINGAGVEDDLDANGQCTIVFSSSQTGVITGHATVDVDVGGTILTRETDGIGDNSGDAVKTYVDATIDITGDGTNRVGASHSFTATVKIDAGDGNGLVAANNVAVTIHKVDASGAVSNPAGNQGCTTDSTGVCSVSFSSNSTGTTTGTASATVTVGGISFGITTANDAAVVGNESVVKTWVDASIDITGDDTNRVNDPHTFTVTVLADDGDGTGPQPVSGQVVSVTLTDSSGGTTVVDDDPDTTSTCDDGTNAAGQCVVVFSSATTGVTTGTASATVTVGGISFLISTATDASTAGNEDATKTWVDARISISGDDTNSIEEAHTFTVLLEKDLGDGNGFVDAAGEDVNVTLANSGGAAYVLDATSTTCDVDSVNTDADTDSNGECVAVFTSNSAGIVNG